LSAGSLNRVAKASKAPVSFPQVSRTVKRRTDSETPYLANK
jgi:hypothetical protein